jgi:hypothetical protein
VVTLVALVVQEPHPQLQDQALQGLEGVRADLSIQPQPQVEVAVVVLVGEVGTVMLDKVELLTQAVVVEVVEPLLVYQEMAAQAALVLSLLKYLTMWVQYSLAALHRACLLLVGSTSTQ